MNKKISIIIPVLNEAISIVECLNNLQVLRKQGHEIIVVDGGSTDNTVLLAAPLSDYVFQTNKSRSTQMNHGANRATGDIYLFLHADTRLPLNITTLFSKIENNEKVWGRFDMKLSGQHLFFRIIEFCMNWRSRLTGIATGDQVIFIEKNFFIQVAGFPEIPLMEDIAISRLLLKHSKPVCFRETVESSSRRWKKNGILKTVIKMWLLRLLYFFNFDTNKLARMYS